MTLRVDIENSLEVPLSGEALFNPHSLWGVGGLYFVERCKDSISIFNSGGSCRDSFFIHMQNNLTDYVKDGFITISLAVPKNRDLTEELDNYIKKYYKIPYFKEIEFSLFKDDIESIKHTYVTKGTYSVVLNKAYALLDFHLLDIKIPIQLFADISIIWTLTWELRYSLLKIGSSIDYIEYRTPYLKLLKDRYNDIILTTDTKLILETWKLYGQMSLAAPIVQWNGPYGIFIWNKKIKNNKTDNDLFRNVFDLHHKYLNVDLLVSSIAKKA